MTITLADLLTVRTQQQCFDDLLTALKAIGFPTSGWSTTSRPRRMLWAFASAQAKVQGWIYDIAKGGLLKYATGNWLTLLMDNLYQETRTAAAYSKGTFCIGDTAGAGPFTISPNQLWFSTDSGLRFYNTTGGSLALNGSLNLSVQAESPGAQYNVAEGAVSKLLTPLPGVGFAKHTPVASTGSSPPAVTVSGTPASEYDFDVEITGGGVLGVAVFRWRVNSGAWTAGVTTGAAVSLAPTGVVAAFGAGTYSVDNVYKWSSGATSYNPSPDWQTDIGRDEQTDESGRSACQGKWSTLGYGQNDDWFKYWVQHEPNYGDTITHVLVETNPGGVFGKISLWLSTDTGAPAGGVITAINAFMQAKKGNVTTLTVDPVVNVTVNVTATINVRNGKATEAEAIAAATLALQAYFAQLPPAETAYLDQVKDSLIYDQTIVRNVTVAAPAGDTAATAHQKCVLGTVTLTIAFV
jgi:hypothetical protein